MSSQDFQQKVLKEAHSAYRFQLNRAGLKALLEFCQSQGSTQELQLHAAQTALSYLAGQVKGRQTINADDIAASVQEYHRRQGDTVLQYASVKVVPLEEYPLIAYNPVQGHYVDASSLQGEMAPPAKNSPMRRVWALRQRYYFALATTRRSRLYVSASTPATQMTPGQMPLLPMKTLEGSSQSKYIAVLGMLSCDLLAAEAGGKETTTKTAGGRKAVLHGEEAIDANWRLEDDTMSIPLVTSSATTASSCGVFAAGCIVIAKGHWDGGKLLVKEICFPPAEARASALQSVTGTDCFGLAPVDHARALRIEKRTENAVVVVMAHIHLDKAETFSMIRNFFERIAQVVAADLTIVLVGDFISQPLTLSDPSHHDETASPFSKYKSLFDSLGATITSAAPNIAAGAQFVIVPGPMDLTPCGATYPQYPLSQGLFAGFLKKCPKTTLAPNPCRLRFGTHEILIARADSQRLWRKPRIVRPLQTAEDGTTEYHPFDHLVRTVVEQGSVVPAIGTSEDDMDVLWARDHALRVFPLPQTVVLCESANHWETNCGDTKFINPGTFSLESTFLWMSPSRRTADLNRL